MESGLLEFLRSLLETLCVTGAGRSAHLFGSTGEYTEGSVTYRALYKEP